MRGMALSADIRDARVANLFGGGVDGSLVNSTTVRAIVVLSEEARVVARPIVEREHAPFEARLRGTLGRMVVLH